MLAERGTLSSLVSVSTPTSINPNTTVNEEYPTSPVPLLYIGPIDTSVWSGVQIYIYDVYYMYINTCMYIRLQYCTVVYQVHFCSDNRVHVCAKCMQTPLFSTSMYDHEALMGGENSHIDSSDSISTDVNRSQLDPITEADTGEIHVHVVHVHVVIVFFKYTCMRIVETIYTHAYSNIDNTLIIYIYIRPLHVHISYIHVVHVYT